MTISQFQVKAEGPAETQPLSKHSLFLATRQFASLDGVRCLCILAVIWHHSPRRLNDGLASRGFLGVDMFFVLSGFLIVTLLLRERRRTGTISLKNFYMRRTLRIFPAYYFLLFGTLAACLAFRSGSGMTRDLIRAFPYLASYTSNWVTFAGVNLGIVWSLATEEQFYLAWPAAEKYLSPRALLVALAAIFAVNVSINFRLLDPLFVAIYGVYPALEILQVTFTPIALGVLLAHALDDSRGFPAIARLVGWPGAPWAFAAGLMLLISLAPGDIAGWPRPAIQFAMALTLASLVVREDHAARAILSWKPIRVIGLISYGMYLYHMWCIHAARVAVGKLGLGEGACFPAAVLVTAAVAAISFRFLEGPALRFKRFFGGAPALSRPPARSADEPGYGRARRLH
ncbi:MAG: acyltransferase [Isosphaeraceae bacterium]